MVTESDNIVKYQAYMPNVTFSVEHVRLYALAQNAKISDQLLYLKSIFF